MNTPQTPPCTDCVFYHKHEYKVNHPSGIWLDVAQALCMHTKSLTDLTVDANGVMCGIVQPCPIMRAANGGKCGPYAKLFEAKQ